MPMTTPIHIDGSQGEGGGQILRSSIALAAVLCAAEVEGCELGSQEASFHPGGIRRGQWSFGQIPQGAADSALFAVLEEK